MKPQQKKIEIWHKPLGQGEGDYNLGAYPDKECCYTVPSQKVSPGKSDHQNLVGDWYRNERESELHRRNFSSKH